MENEEYTKAASAVVKYLSRVMRTKVETEKYLRGKGFSEAAVEYAVGKAEEYGYLNDARFAELYVGQYSRTGGRRKIKFGLKQKGLSDAAAEAALGELSVEDEIAAARAIAQKYMRSKDDTRENRAKLYRHLAGKGFSFDIIGAVVGEDIWQD